MTVSDVVQCILPGDGMAERNAQALAEWEETERAYIQEGTGTSTADELPKLAGLREKESLPTLNSTHRRPTCSAELRDTTAKDNSTHLPN